MTAPALEVEPDRSRLLRRCTPYVGPHRRRIALALLLAVAASLATGVVPRLVGAVVDAVLAGEAGTVRVLVGLGLAAAVSAAVLLRFGQSGLVAAAELVVRDLREELLRRLARAPVRFLEEHRGGELLQRTTVEVADLAAVLRSILPQLVVGSATSLVLLVALVVASPLLAVPVVVGLALASVWALRSFRTQAPVVFRAQAEAEAAATASFGDVVAGRVVLQGVPGSAAEFLAAADTDARAVVTTTRRVVDVENRVERLGLAEGVLAAVLLVLGGFLVARGDATVGVVVTFLLSTRAMFGAVTELSALAGELADAGTTLARTLQVLDATGEPADRPRRSLPGRGDLTVTELGFAYDDVEVLRGVDGRWRSGERVALVGESGAGKSTLAKLLTGLYVPTRGAVRYAGVDLGDVEPEELRRRIVLVAQDVHVGSGTVAEALALAGGDPGRPQMLAAVRALGLQPFLDRLPDGLDTPVGVAGCALSAGERQLVALVRAALTGAAVLVLDEATSDVDPTAAAEVEAAVERLSDERIVIVIAHRAGTVERLSRVDEVRDGRLLTR